MSTSTDTHLEDRLAVLRRLNPDGYGTTDTTATEPTGAVSVTIDPTDRVRDVRVARPDLVDSPDRLAEAVATAYVIAVRARRDALRGPRSGEMPVARNDRLPIAQVQNWADEGWLPDPATVHMHDFHDRDLGSVEGVSDNDCVTVRLDRASSYGHVAADPGWLANATNTQISAAVTQAFAAAYRERDDR